MIRLKDGSILVVILFRKCSFGSRSIKQKIYLLKVPQTANTSAKNHRAAGFILLAVDSLLCKMCVKTWKVFYKTRKYLNSMACTTCKEVLTCPFHFLSTFGKIYRPKHEWHLEVSSPIVYPPSVASCTLLPGSYIQKHRTWCQHYDTNIDFYTNFFNI